MYGWSRKRAGSGHEARTLLLAPYPTVDADLLRGDELRVTELAELFALSLAGASKHIRVIEDAGLIQRTVVM